MGSGARGHRRGTSALLAIAVVLFAASLWVRGIRAELPPAPEDRAGSETSIAEPMHFLSGGAENRFEELTRHVSEPQRASWRTQSALLFDLEGCPHLREWIETRDGQRLERMLGELRGGTREDALAALTLIFQLARVTKWNAGAEHAEHLGGLLADWLRAWAERSADDALLHEPALAAAVFYGRVMEVAWNAPAFGHVRASYEHARTFLSELTGEREGARTAFGRELELRMPRALAALFATSEEAFFAAFHSEAEIFFPGLDGSCDG
jgi:hypothetical protein